MKLECSVCNEIKELDKEDMKDFYESISKHDKKIKVSEYPSYFSMWNEKTCFKKKKHVYLFTSDTEKVIKELNENHEKTINDERLLSLDRDDIDLTIKNCNKMIEDAQKGQEKCDEKEILINNKKIEMNDKMIEILGTDNYDILSYSNEDELELIEEEMKRLDEEENNEKGNDEENEDDH